ncbi:MAG: ABC transporter ATP-binding protein [Planctomycetes bacterium]|nr:ABC transporter ATP-binding protein [Planctomycetota bacterium]
MRGINLTVEEGEYVSIMGPSGSGKSTLLNIIGCLDTLTSGTYRLDDEEVANLSENDLARIRNRKIGFVFQSFNLIPRATVLRNVEIPMIYSGKPNRREVAKDLVRFVGLEKRLLHTPNQLSGGEQQRVAIARALANDPAIILADEPTGSIDSATGEKIMALLTTLHEQGNTVIVVTHDEYVAGMTNRIIRIRDGKIIREDWIVHF